MKKNWYIVFSLLMFFIGRSFVYGANLDIASQNAVLYRLKDDKIVYEKNAYERIPIASMTKIMTAIIALENIESLDDTVVITKEDFAGLREAGASLAGFKVGQMVTYRDLLYGLLLPSGAEAALSLTRNIAGNRENFVQMMNEKAKVLGMNNTHFENETGLDQENHYSTVYEVLNLFRYALTNEDFYQIVTSHHYISSDGTLKMESTLFHTMEKFQITSSFLEGGKTGTTRNAGLCLASIAHLNGEEFLSVTARSFYEDTYSPLHIEDANKIYEYFAENYQDQIVLDIGDEIASVDTKYLFPKKITFVSDKQIVAYLPKDYQKDDITMEYIGPKEITTRLLKEKKLGIVHIRYQNQILDTLDISLKETLSIDWISYLEDHKREMVFIVSEIILFGLTFYIFYKNGIFKRRKEA